MTNGQYPYGPLQMSMNNAYGSHAYRNSGSGNGGFSFGMNFSGRPVLLHGVNFKYNSAELTPESGIVLDRVASRLRVTPGLAAEVGDHAVFQRKKRRTYQQLACIS